MITRVELTNFQSHKHTIVDLVEGVNVIIGPSDAGKSALFRAINWVVGNRPLGDAYRSDWGGDTSVTITTSEGHVVTRIRTDKQNAYIVDGVTLTAFGSEPPDDVFAALAIDPYNVQGQADPPFLLAASPGEVAAALNRAAAIDDIDHATGGLRRGAAALSRDLAYNQGQLDDYRAQLATYDGLPAVEALVEAAEAAAAEVDAVAARYAALRQLTVRIHSLATQLAATEHLAGAGDALGAAQAASTELAAAQAQYTQLAALQRQMRKAQRGLAGAAAVISVADTIERAEAARKMLDTTRTQWRQLSRLHNQAAIFDSARTKADEDLAALQAEWDTIAPDTCPLCGNPMGAGGHDNE